MSSINEVVAKEYKGTVDIKTLATRDKHIKDSWVNAMEVRIVREELIKCHKVEGVNHYAECKHLSELYLKLMRENKVKGYKQIDLAAKTS
ncbi:hypothetical protein M407DRAFT_23996 [Tulasnella calospora MUT 4182]|uniref:NADH-ubiquinone oxidoreductase 12 kDa subunit n=1 Tax=Tulasnella calospora MUT 4182 TaxID=1051891 RepID=A0A0C3LZG8_9AGAM|nr:hypothetical protein M407DRAFT_33248 [Tulasnella calospora MUT 4182]KIO26802.1 hypothetical protein M407DRAFT_23996 [Tulasnella calospora MUT 4182]